MDSDFQEEGEAPQQEKLEELPIAYLTFPQEWRRAAELLKPLNRPPQYLSGMIRSFIRDVEKEQTRPSEGSFSDFRRVFKSGTVKAIYYYFTKSYRPEFFENPDELGAKEFFRAFSPIEHSAIIAYCYLYRMILKMSDREEWSFINEPFYDAIGVGGCVGSAIPKIGLGFGTLTRGVRYLALAPLLWNSKEKFKEYRRHLKNSDKAFDTEKELEGWGCSSLHIATLIIQMLGFNSSIGAGYFDAIGDSPASKLEPKFGTIFRATDKWIDHLMEGKELPPELTEEFRLDGKKLEDLIQTVKRVVQSPDRIEWLSKGKGNISPERTPELFRGGEALTVASVEPPDDQNEADPSVLKEDE